MTTDLMQWIVIIVLVLYIGWAESRQEEINKAALSALKAIRGMVSDLNRRLVAQEVEIERIQDWIRNVDDTWIQTVGKRKREEANDEEAL